MIDGHNRFEICSRLGLSFGTVIKDFASRDDAVLWIINNQMGRRNITDYQKGVLVIRFKDIVSARAKAQQVEGGAIGGGKLRPLVDEPISDEAQPENGDETVAVVGIAPITPMRTDVTLAGMANIGKTTLRRIEQIEKVAAPEIKTLAAAGDVSINLASQFVALPTEIQEEAVRVISQSSEPAKEVMREAVHNHRAIGTGGNHAGAADVRKNRGPLSFLRLHARGKGPRIGSIKFSKLLVNQIVAQCNFVATSFDSIQTINRQSIQSF